MQHTIPVEQLDAQGPAMVHAIEACVHCGFCLPTCPTYQVLGEEMDSPRGRIFLMKSVLEGALSVDEAAPFVDRCLGCLGCVTACPSGVPYGELIAPFRAYAEERRSRPRRDRLQRTLVRETLPFPGRFRAAAALGRLARPIEGMMPAELRGALSLLPEHLPGSKPLPSVYPAAGQRRARVALLAGCVQQVLSPEINWATLRVLAQNGVEILIPPGQGCCGALMLHTGEADRARQLAATNLQVFPRDVDAIITNTAGCGSGIREYGLLFRGTPLETEAADFASKVRDVSEFLAELGIETPPDLPGPIKLAYHDACHLAHAQGVTDAPRKLLRRIGNVTLVDIPGGDICCGSAGTYNLEQPVLADALGRRKAENLLSTGCDVIAAGNVGCLVQIDSHLRKLNQPLPIYHTMEILDRAYRQVAV